MWVFFSQKSESDSIFLIKIPSKYGIVKIVIQKNQRIYFSVILLIKNKRKEDVYEKEDMGYRNSSYVYGQLQPLFSAFGADGSVGR